VEKRRFKRKELGAALRALGYPISDSTLNKLCAPAVNKGPPIAGWFGPFALYDLDPGIAWAESRLRPARSAPQPQPSNQDAVTAPDRDGAVAIDGAGNIAKAIGGRRPRKPSRGKTAAFKATSGGNPGMGSGERSRRTCVAHATKALGSDHQKVRNSGVTATREQSNLQISTKHCRGAA
jgi:hypothetical protein